MALDDRRRDRAGDAGVQPSAVIRFANALGFAASRRCSSVFREHLVARSRDLSRAHRGDARGARGGGDTSGRRAAPASSASRSASSSTCASSHRAGRVQRGGAARRAARGRSTCSRSGARFRSPRYLAYGLNQLELPRICSTGVGGMLRSSVAGGIGRKRRAASPSAFATTRRRCVEIGRRVPRPRRAGDRDHRRPLSPLKPSARICLRARRRLPPSVPLAGRAVVPRAGAGRQCRSRITRSAAGRNGRNDAGTPRART